MRFFADINVISLYKLNESLEKATILWLWCSW